jgi:hypothetical protein
MIDGPCLNRNSDGECIVGIYNGAEGKFPECSEKNCPFNRAFRENEYDQKLVEKTPTDEYQDEIIEDEIQDLGIIYFGIHKGKQWNELPMEYLDFLASEKCTIKEELKNLARKAMANRKIIKDQLKIFGNNT